MRSGATGDLILSQGDCKNALYSYKLINNCWAPRISWLGTFWLFVIFLRAQPWRMLHLILDCCLSLLFPFVPSLPDQVIVLIHLYKIVWMEHLLLHQWQGMVLHHPRLWWECLCFHQDRWCLHHQVDLVSNYFFIGFYCMASSVSGQDNPNPALWLVVQAGKMALSWPLRTTHCVLQERIARKPCNKSLIDQAWLITHTYWLTVMHTVSI